jgi:hypothetical protein
MNTSVQKLIFLCVLISMPCAAFDINTHAAMTAEAIKQSKITASPNTSAVFRKLGLYDRDSAIGSAYIDFGSVPTRRSTTKFEKDIMDDVGDTDATGLVLPLPHSIPGWIVRGAIREDDNTKDNIQGRPEADEPGGVFDRVLAHFFDPFNNRGLTVAGVPLGPR